MSNDQINISAIVNEMAAKAADDWSPFTQNHCPQHIAWSRKCYAHGFASAMYRALKESEDSKRELAGLHSEIAYTDEMFCAMRKTAEEQAAWRALLVREVGTDDVAVLIAARRTLRNIKNWCAARGLVGHADEPAWLDDVDALCSVLTGGGGAEPASENLPAAPAKDNRVFNKEPGGNP